MRLTALPRRLRLWWRRVDPYVTRSVTKRYRAGMINFWWYGVFLAMSDAFVGSFMTLFIFALGGTSLQVGTLASLSSLAGLLMPIPGAQWVAKWGRRKPVVLISFTLRHIALLGAVIAPFAVAEPGVVWIAMGVFFLRAAFLHLGHSPWTTFAGEIIPGHIRGRYFASRKTVMALSSLICVPLAGQLIGLFEDPLGYQIAFALAIVWAVIALVLYGRIPEQRSDQTEAIPANVNTSAANIKKASPSRPLGLRSLWQALRANQIFWRFVLISMFFNFVWQLGGPYFGTYQVEVLGATSEVVGWLTMASAFMRMVGQQVFGRLVDRRGARWAFTFCLLFIPILPFIWLPLRAPWQIVFVYIPSGFLWAGREVANFNLLLELAGEDQQTEAVASYNTLLALASMLGPLVGGWVVTSLGYHWDFALSGIGRLVAAVLFVVLLRPFDRRLSMRSVTSTRLTSGNS